MTTFFISDTHFRHDNILKFVDVEGNKIRPGFSSIDHMDETIIENWNKVVKPYDTVYHMGDVGFCNELQMRTILKRLNGKKRLILGNHDNLSMTFYASMFEEVYSLKAFTTSKNINFKLCHYPLHVSSFQYNPEEPAFCVHGHIHQRLIYDPLYINLCVEHLNYTPISMDELELIMIGRLNIRP